MFFNKKHLEPLGYKIIGFNWGSLNSLYNYAKMFEATKSMVVFSTVYDNTVAVYKMTDSQWDDYNNGFVAISHDGTEKPNGTPSGTKIISVWTKILHWG